MSTCETDRTSWRDIRDDRVPTGSVVAVLGTVAGPMHDTTPPAMAETDFADTRRPTQTPTGGAG